MRSRVSFAALAVLMGAGLDPAAGEEAQQSPAVAPGLSAPASATDIEALRGEIEALREQVRLLREQMADLKAAQSPAWAAGVAARPVAASPQAAGAAPQGTPIGAPARSQNLMNPAIGAVFQAIGATSTEHSDGERNGFDLSEAEIAFQSVVDPYARFDLFLAFPSTEAPEVEEGYVTTLALPRSLQLKGGRFKSAFGKWNTLHNHAFFTVERPNALTNFFGEESLADDGLSLSVLVPNPWSLYIESSTQIGTPRPGNSFNSEKRGLMYLEHLSWFFTPSANGNFEVGLSAARGKTGASGTLIEALASCGAPCAGLRTRSELDSAVDGIDLTYKWKPLRLNVYKSFLWQTELLRARRDVDVLDPATPALNPGRTSSLGGYSYVEWQVRKRWRIGARYDLSEFPDDEAARERAAVAVIRFQPSEFQEIRFQYKRTARNAAAAARFDDEDSDSQIFFQWIPVIGAHGAHKF